jgi:hypothetical protein
VSRPVLRGRLRPTEQQRLLLLCALGDDAVVHDSWARVRPGLDLDSLDEGSHGVLPLVYDALARTGIAEPLLPRLKGIYKKAWFANQLLLDGARRPLGMLRHAGVEPLLLHGSAVMAAYYPGAAKRRVPFLDVAVRPGSEERALRALERTGWTRHPDQAGEETYPAPLVDVDGRLMFLHAGLPDALAGGQDAMFERAIEIDVGGTPARVLEPTDQLLCVCATGADVTLVPQAQWLADAAVLITEHPIDWDALAERAAERMLSVRVAAALAYLEGDLGLPVRRLPAPRSRRETLEYALYTRPNGFGAQRLARQLRQRSASSRGS